MNRRTFVKLSTAALCACPAVGAVALQHAISPKPEWLQKLIQVNDQRLKALQAYRVADEKSPAFGGFLDGTDIPNPHSTVGFIRTAICALVSEESEFYKSKQIKTETEQALTYLLKIQHADGTLDLLSTNFHSTPDTGFIVKWTAPLHTLLRQADAVFFEPTLGLLQTFLKRAGESLIVGGIHTPNHRWVVSAALGALYQLWPDVRYAQRAEQWLAEHIDMDEDGQYNERSTYIYSPLTNRVLITIARTLNKPELYEYVRKNLAMTLYYIHPNGEVVTEASGRQDKAAVGNMDGYYYAYRYMALRDSDGTFAAMCREIEQTVLDKVAGHLSYFLEDQTLWRELPAAKKLPVNYVRTFPRSGLVRIRRNEWDATLISNNPVWLTFHKGNAILQGMRVAASFFGKGQFETETITQQGTDWLMTRRLEGPYYQPLSKEKIRDDGDWEKMPRSGRKQSEVQVMTTTIVIRERGNGLEIDLKLEGTDGVPVALELIFREGTFKGVQSLGTGKEVFLLPDNSTGTCTVGSHTLTFGPGRAAHKAVQLRGALPAMNAPTVYLTGFTPFIHTLRIS
ncbi:hypothetical protein [Arundinibacter roseus]|uniref:Heparinase n=1 Tax=Arundinibacter roseus TaxID=2070510 RepID=A0A4R4KCH9_9BACT|nr:hypothetical protein [Arundinibacter roseus]TDB64181.1 hypothetical protein EZE20_14700 [Arundinibacter roseus]